MWPWIFAAIGTLGLTWHVLLLVRIAKKSKSVLLAATPMLSKMNEISGLAGKKPKLNKPLLAIDEKMDVVLVERYKFNRQRRLAKAERQRRLIDNLKKIDPTESRFIRVRKRS